MSFYFLDVVFGLVNLVLCLVCLSWMYMAIVRARGWSVVKTLLLCLSFATMLRAFIFLIVAMKFKGTLTQAIPTEGLFVLLAFPTYCAFVSLTIVMYSWLLLFNKAALYRYDSVGWLSYQQILLAVNGCYTIVELVKWLVVFSRDDEAGALHSFGLGQALAAACMCIAFLVGATYMFSQVGDRVKGDDDGVVARHVTVLAGAICLCTIVQTGFSFVHDHTWSSDVASAAILFIAQALVVGLSIGVVQSLPAARASDIMYSMVLGEDSALGF